MEQKITAGRDELGGFAPKFAQLNDDVLFGEVWAREEALSARDRSIVTVTALMAGGNRHAKGCDVAAPRARLNMERQMSGDLLVQCRHQMKGMGSGL